MSRPEPTGGDEQPVFVDAALRAAEQERLRDVRVASLRLASSITAAGGRRIVPHDHDDMFALAARIESWIGRP